MHRTDSWRGLVPVHLIAGNAERPTGHDTDGLPGVEGRSAPLAFWVGDQHTQ